MSIQQSTNRILTTHVGSLPRPNDLLDLMKAKMTSLGYDQEVYEARVRSAVAECVRKQAETGIDILTDGEQSKPGFFTYHTVTNHAANIQPWTNAANRAAAIGF